MSKKSGLSALLLGCGLTVLALVALAPTVALADEVSLPPAASSEVAAPCEVSLDELLAQEIATPSIDPLFGMPEVIQLGFRTCKCSCGDPCVTNGDCGIGGICQPGISCC